jgi:hypothetical protein
VAIESDCSHIRMGGGCERRRRPFQHAAALTVLGSLPVVPVMNEHRREREDYSPNMPRSRMLLVFRKPSENEGSETQQQRRLIPPNIDVPKPLVFGTLPALRRRGALSEGMPAPDVARGGQPSVEAIRIPGKQRSRPLVEAISISGSWHGIVLR